MSSLRTALVFIAVLVAALLFGALAAYPVYALLAQFEGMEFHRVIGRTTSLSGLLFSLLYLRYCGLLSAQGLGWQGAGYNKKYLLAGGFAAGALIIGLLAACLLSLEIYRLDPRVDTGLANMMRLLSKAVLAGLLVGLVEEILFRGALLGGLRKQANTAIAVVSVSLVYAAAHFIKYRAVPAEVEIGWFTGVAIFPEALFRFSNPVTVDSFLTLFILGILFALVRVRSASLIPCIGLHAGIVAGLKLFNYLSNYAKGSDYDFLVNRIDHQFGYLASLVLLAALLFYLAFSASRAEGSASSPGV